MVNLVKHDLVFILNQIKIAEAHAAGGDLATLVAGYNGNDGLAQAHLLPYGLRTVDGSYNNLLPGRENWGAADQSFPGIFTPNYMNDADGDRYDFDPRPGIETWYTNNNYANAGTTSGSSPGPGSGTVIDADPRIISNLIVDQTLNNPAAIATALTHAGLSGQPLMTALAEIVNAHTILKAIPAPGDGQQPSSAYSLAKTALNAKLAQYGVEMDGNTVYLPNVSPDEGLSSPFNGWMTIFGQFFDHGLDLVAKGGNGTIYVPLSPDDPLYSTAPGAQNYIPLTRVTVNPGADGILGTADDGPGPKNLTTPWVDQNQTYGSTASKQVFMREYRPAPAGTLDASGNDISGKPIATGHLLEGGNGGLATWADIKHQAKTVLGIELTDLNVGNIPLIATDPYGNFIPGPNGYPQLVVSMGDDGVLGTADDVLREGNPAAPVAAQGVAVTGHAFLDDIAHTAVPVVSNGVLQADADDITGNAVPSMMGRNTQYDNELLDRHFVAGDGRANENIALTAVHQVFHSEHNRVVEHTKDVTLKSMDRAFINEWLLTDLTDTQYATITSGDAGAVASLSAALNWDGERLFQVGRFTNEMEYQHLVFEEFGRMMQPDIDAFVFEPSADINPSIAAEFAHVVYRFGHSMLRQDIAIIQMDADGKPVIADVKLFDGFLNPVMYDSLGDAEAASGAIIRGMSRQTGSEIDEFVTDVLRNQLLGIPLDLATINLARGRDVGTPSLNTARDKFFVATGDTLLKPYNSWADFALNLKNPASIINFIAAYGTHETLINTQANPKTVEQLRDAATKLVLGGAGAPADRLDFLNATGAYAGGSLGGLNNVDFWIGGLAEKKMAFGGMLGSTFSFVFQMTMENLQDADRFYYLSRTQGLNLLNELENNTFAELVMRNTDLGDPDSTALPGNLFSAFDMPQLEMDISKQLDPDPVSDDPFLGGFSKLVERVDANNDGVAEAIRINSNEHFVIGGTENNDKIISGGGDDAIWGKGGNDTIEAGYGVDKVFGGEGDDIITNAGTDIGEADFLHGNEGNDVIHGGSGLSLIFGNQGNDFISTGPDGKEAFGGTGNDFIVGGSGGDALLGNEGDDWLEGGQRFDSLSGENSELFFNSTIVGHDVLNGGSGDTDYDGESGDDIMFQSEGIQRSNGMAGFDWAIHKGDAIAANSDLGIPIFDTQEAFILRDRFDLVEGLSGWNQNDTLTGRIVPVNTRAEATGTAAIPGPDSPLDSYSNDLLAKNVGLINGLSGLVAHLGAGVPVTKVVNGQTVPVLDENGVQERIIVSTADASDILLGGGGSDRIKGLAGNDIIDGDKWLNVRIAIHANKDGTGPVIGTADGMTGKVYALADYVNGAPKDGAVPLYDGKGLDALMFTATLNPGQLSIVREIVDGNKAGDVDTAVYTDVVANYSFGTNSDGSVFVDHSGFTQPQGDDDVPEDEAAPNPRSDGRDTVRGIEKLEFSDGTVNVIEGSAAGETLNGTAGADLLVGKAGNDTLNGLGGNDILLGGAGNDNLNGGVGNDTYFVGLAEGADTINEAASAGSADRVVIQAAGAALTGLNASDNNTGTNNGSLVLAFNGQSITVEGHYTGTNAQTGVELINFDNATYQGYDLGADDYVVSRADPAGFGSRTVNLSGSVANNLVAGESGSDNITGGAGNDLIFGNAGNDGLVGGDGDDLLVGGSGNDDLDGGLGADVMDGGTGDDTYVVDDAGDVVVEAANGGTDEVETALAAYSLTANVENLTYTGGGAFAGTGNALNNVITGGAGVDTLSGLEGNDWLDGGTGADVMDGGTGDDTYVVDNAGDQVVELANAGTDMVRASVSHMLGANVENLILTATGAIEGRGNDLANAITGNNAANQLFGGSGNDNLNGGGGNDVLDGGTGDDILDGSTGDDTIIGGAGNDTVNLGTNGGNDTIAYTAPGFGADIINNFDANAQGGQDRIDLSAFGITAVNFNQRVVGTAVGTGNTLLSIRDANAAEIGTIRINGVATTAIDASDFILAPSTATPLPGATNLANTLNGTNGNDLIDALAGNDTVNANGGNDTIIGGLGNDILNGGAGDDTIIWNANASGTTTDGRDYVNGSTEGGLGDMFVINGNASAETYYIFTRAAWDALPGNSTFNLRNDTEIVITRGGTSNASIIAELVDIEEIRINGNEPTATGAIGGDTINIVGDFSGTSLRPNTITIDGNEGDDTVDISALSSAHRIVFRSNGGNDTIVGTLRPQDVIELPAGTVLGDYEITTDENGVTTMTREGHSICFTSVGGLPQFGSGEGHDDEEEETPPGNGGGDTGSDEDEEVENPGDDNGSGDDDEEEEDDSCGHDDGEGAGSGDNGGGTTPPVTQPDTSVGAPIAGTNGTEVLVGTARGETIMALDGNDNVVAGAGTDVVNGGAGNDFLSGEAGRDMMFGGDGDDTMLGGSDADMLYGDAGNDRVFGDDGNDLIDAGAGNDTVYGGAGDDLIAASANDGNDVYYGDDMAGGTGTDTLDMSAITANITANLGGNGASNGSVFSSQSGSDTVWGIENIVTGSGNDTITASHAVNVIDGGAGNDVFRFLSTADANGDTILGFQPGDRLDLSAIDANGGVGGKQAFTLANGSSFSGPAQLVISYETRDDGDYTVVSGNTTGPDAAEFKISLKGTHDLQQSDFVLS